LRADVRPAELFFGTDYPGFPRPGQLLDKLRTVNESAARPPPGDPQTKIDGIMGDNIARMMGWIRLTVDGGRNFALCVRGLIGESYHYRSR
jgi:hypothetical protein